jgi:hypothetical protein
VSPAVNVNIGNNQNYIITTTVRKPGVWNSGNINGLAPVDRHQNITYLDGVGRSVQEIAIQGSASGKDIVSFSVYDNVGRSPRNYLPYAGGNDGSLKVNPASEASTFYYDLKGDAVAFADTRFENAPSNRVLEEGAVGGAWQLSTGHTTKMAYSKNVYGDVRQWNYNAANESERFSLFFFLVILAVI